MKQNIKDINKLNISKKYFLKKEIKIKILKSIIQNKKINLLIKVLLKLKILKIYKHKKKNKINNICFLNGSNNSVFKKFDMCRHTIYKYNKFIKINNLLIKSW
jgi:ribosomal protein S14